MCLCSENVDFLDLGRVLHPVGGGFSIQGGSPSQGVLHLGGFSIRGGSPSGGSPSRGSPSWGGFSIPGGVLHPRGVLHPWGGSPSQGGSPSGGVPCDLYHHAFDVTCMLPPHQLRHTNCAPAYILPGHVTCNASLGYPPPHGQTDTCKNITFANYVCGR